MDMIAPADIRYIKLGTGGTWATRCIEKGEMHLDYRTVPHEPCAAHDWERVAQILAKGSEPKTDAPAREIRAFYTLGSECLWITFHGQQLWWAFAEPEVIWLGEPDAMHGSRMRRTVGRWRNTTITGEPLYMDALSTRLTQVASYQRTICRVQTPDYLVRRINGLEEPMVAEARSAHRAMVIAALKMIKALDWRDFEVMVDLIFSRSGWQRVSALGGTMKDADLILRQPSTGERAMVQVKSKATQGTLNDYIRRFREGEAFDRFFFVCHTSETDLKIGTDRNMHLWAGAELAAAAITAGLYDWLIEKSD